MQWRQETYYGLGLLPTGEHDIGIVNANVIHDKQLSEMSGNCWVREMGLSVIGEHALYILTDY